MLCCMESEGSLEYYEREHDYRAALNVLGSQSAHTQERYLVSGPHFSADL